MNRIYPAAKQAFLQAYFLGNGPIGGIDLKVAGIEAGYGYDVTHSRIADLGGHVITPYAVLLNVTLASGVIRADDLVPAFTGLDPALVIRYLAIIAQFDAGDLLVGLIDTTSNDSLPIAVGTSDINITWDARGILTL